MSSDDKVSWDRKKIPEKVSSFEELFGTLPDNSLDDSSMLINLRGIDNMTCLIIRDEGSPITYSNQTSDNVCTHQKAKGYLVPITLNGKVLERLIAHEYTSDGQNLDDSFYMDADEIIEQINDFFDSSYSFGLDANKINDNRESWVYLVGMKNNNCDESRGIIKGFPEVVNAILTWPSIN